MRILAFNPGKYSIVKSLRADASWFADVLEELTVATSAARADAPDCAWEGGAWQAKWRLEPAADDLHQLRAYFDAPGRTSCSLLRFLLSPAFLEWARKDSGISTSTRRDCTCVSDTAADPRGPIPGTWTALVAHHRADLTSRPLSPVAMPTGASTRSGTSPYALYNHDAARWTVRFRAIAPHYHPLPGHMPWHIQPPAGPQHENLSDRYRSPIAPCTCALPDHSNSTMFPSWTRDLAGVTNRRLLHEHHLDIASSVTSTALLDQLCPQSLRDALTPPHDAEDADRPAGAPVFVLISWIPHDHTDEHEPCGRAEQPVVARHPDEHTDTADPDADTVLNTLKLLCDNTPSSDRTVLDTVQLLGDTSLGTTPARATRHAGSVRATADIINRYNAKVRRHNQTVEKNAEKNARTAERRLNAAVEEIRRYNDQVKRHNDQVRRQQRLRGHPTDGAGNTSPSAVGDTGITSG